MTEVINFLEKIGTIADSSVEECLRNSELSSELSEAIIKNDISTLASTLNISKDIICFLVPAEDDEKESETEEEQNDVESVVNG